MKKKNPTLEEFSSDRFNPIRKILGLYNDDLKSTFKSYGWDTAVAEEMKKKSLLYLDETFKKYFNIFQGDKIKLEFALDFLYVHWFTRILHDLVTKHYRPEAKLFTEAEKDLDYDDVMEFLVNQKHWITKFFKPLREVLTRRGVFDLSTHDQRVTFSVMQGVTSLNVNLENLAAHFISLLPLPEYRPLKKFKWNEFTFVFDQHGSLDDFARMELVEKDITETLKDKLVPPAQEIEVSSDIATGREIISSESKRYLRKGIDFIVFEDGSKWVNLNIPACSYEGAHLEHCGNTYRSDEANLRVLSFRTPTDDPKYFVGRLTFIYNIDTKMIGEAKGRGNSKPASKYHPYIVQLLLNDMIVGLEQGRHATERDFAFADLSDELLEVLIEKKPTLFSKSKVGRSVIISRKLLDKWKISYKKFTGETPPDLESLKFDK